MSASAKYSLELEPAGRIDYESQLFEFVVKQGHGVKGLALGANESTSALRSPTRRRIDRKQVVDASPYLCAPIDLAGLEEKKSKEEVVRALCGAAEKLGWGSFRW